MVKRRSPRTAGARTGTGEKPLRLVPDDVRAELDAEARRDGPEAPPADSALEVPEDVLAEQDAQARAAAIAVGRDDELPVAPQESPWTKLK
jgi:hypothetical protein